jgi:hypothetical protein
VHRRRTGSINLAGEAKARKGISEMRPLAKATRMTSSQKASAVSRKRAAGNPGGKPTNVATFAKRKKWHLED